MALILAFSFDTPDEGISATSFARLLCDLQHLSLVTVASQVPERIPLSSAVFDPVLQKYSVFIEMRDGALGFTELRIRRISQGSPLTLEGVLRLPKVLAGPVRNAFRILFNKIFFLDLEREQRRIRNAAEAEELRHRRFENFAKESGLADKIRDPQLRELYMNGLRSSVAPFEREHPHLLRAAVYDQETPEDADL